MGARHCPWGGLTNRNICNIYGYHGYHEGVTLFPDKRIIYIIYMDIILQKIMSVGPTAAAEGSVPHIRKEGKLGNI